MWKCKHCENEFNFETTSEKANHSRWCSENPKSKDTKKLKIANQKATDKKYGIEKEFDVVCDKCDKEFKIIEREKQFPKKEKYFCNRNCANSHIISDEHKAKTSNSLKGVKKKVKSNISFCKDCNTCFEGKDRTFCNHKCRSNYSLKNYDDLKLYRHFSSFKFDLKDYPDKYDFSLIEKYGWYKAKNHGDNQNGVSRDHIISVKYGFDNNIPTWIIAHPANCQLLRHKENVSKYSKCDLTLDELMIKIKKW